MKNKRWRATSNYPEHPGGTQEARGGKDRSKSPKPLDHNDDEVRQAPSSEVVAGNLSPSVFQVRSNEVAW